MTNVWTLIVIGLAVTGSVIAAFCFFRLWKASMAEARAKREHDLAERKRQQLLDRQENIGNRICNALREAAARNAHTERLAVQPLKQNGHLGYSIIVGWREGDCFTLGGLGYRGYAIVQIDVNLATEPSITVSYGPYPNRLDGTYKTYEADDLGVSAMINSVGEHITNYSPYKKA